MSPIATTGTATGISAALVIVLTWVLSLLHIVLPSDVAMAFGTIITIVGHSIVLLISAFLNRRTRNAAAVTSDNTAAIAGQMVDPAHGVVAPPPPPG